MYKKDFEFDYMIEALVKYNKRTVRTSISMPMDIRDIDPLDHMEGMKESVFKFFRVLENMGVIPNYDCNLMPLCITTEEEKKWLNNFEVMKYNLNRGKSNILSSPHCNPVIDINVDLIAIRCFALSQETKADIRLFRDIQELNSFYMAQIDSFKTIIPASKRCETCELAIKGVCTGGCLGYKIKRMEQAREMLSQIKYEGGN